MQPDCEIIKLIIISGDDGGTQTPIRDRLNRNTRVRYDLYEEGEIAYASEGRYNGHEEMSNIYYPKLQTDAIEMALRIAKRYNQESILVVYKNRMSWLYYTKKNKKPRKVGYFNWLGRSKPNKSNYTKVWLDYYVTRWDNWDSCWREPFDNTAPLRHPR